MGGRKPGRPGRTRDRHAAEDREFKEQQQASIEADPTFAEQPALRIIHMGSDLPEIPADVKRVAELQKQQAEIRNAILEDFEDLDSIETILALRNAMSAAARAPAGRTSAASPKDRRRCRRSRHPKGP